jgi:GT2 family glycosyltransferase
MQGVSRAAVRPRAEAGADSMRIAVGIATSGRRATLAETLVELSRQTRLPDRVLICPATRGDVDEAQFDTLPFPIEVVTARLGLPLQRNAILRATSGFDVLVFFDDDFFPDSGYLANLEALLLAEPRVVAATGTLIADGIHGPGIAAGEARRQLADPGERPAPSGTGARPCYGVYGCNMAIRLAPVRVHDLRFDEALPLYAWQEDIDFSRQLARFGEIVKSPDLIGVHLGVKGGRSSGKRLGYSQIANPIYLIRKGTMSRLFGLKTMARNLLANTVKILRPEPHVDRVGRLKGNLLALADLIRGRMFPGRILEID